MSFRKSNLSWNTLRKIISWFSDNSSRSPKRTALTAWTRVWSRLTQVISNAPSRHVKILRRQMVTVSYYFRYYPTSIKRQYSTELSPLWRRLGKMFPPSWPTSPMTSWRWLASRCKWWVTYRYHVYHLSELTLFVWSSTVWRGVKLKRKLDERSSSSKIYFLMHYPRSILPRLNVRWWAKRLSFQLRYVYKPTIHKLMKTLFDN